VLPSPDRPPSPSPRAEQWPPPGVAAVSWVNQVPVNGGAVSFAGMASVIKSVSFDAADALVLARFWAAALGSDVDEDSTADKAFVEAAGWGGPNIWFTRVPEAKAAKNRVHFDLRVLRRTRPRNRLIPPA
jgi:glyoxalase superfamily protein